MLLAARSNVAFEVELLELDNSLEYITKLENIARERKKFEQFENEDKLDSLKKGQNWLHSERENSLLEIKQKYRKGLQAKLRRA